MDNHLLALLKNHALIKNLNEEIFQALAKHIEIKTYSSGSYLLQEGDLSDELYLILKGKINLLKYDKDQKAQYILDTLGSGDEVGEISFLDGSPRSCGIKCIEETTVAIIKKENILSNKKLGQSVIYSLSNNIAKDISKKLKHTNDNYVESLESQIASLKNMIHFGRFFMMIIVGLGLSSIFTAILLRYPTGINVRTLAFNWVYLIILFIPIGYFITKYHEPISTFGIATVNLKKSLLEALLLIILITPILFYICGYTFNQSIMLFLNLDAVGYLVHSFLQEFIARGVAQTTIMKFLSDRTGATSIILASFLFSMFHLQLGLQAVLITFLSGLLFGYIFLRQKNIFGVSLVHFFLGWVALSKIV